jgi:transposase
MAKRKFNLTAEQVTELKTAYTQSDDAAFSNKVLAIRMYGTGNPVSTILDLVGCNRGSLLKWCRQYKEVGLERLIDQRNGGNHHKLTPAQKSELRDRLQRYKPRQVLGEATATAAGEHWTTADLKQVIAKWYQVTYRSPTSYTTLMVESGMSYQRTEAVFKNRSEAKVADFEEAFEKN